MGISIKHDGVEEMIRRMARYRSSSLIDAIEIAMRRDFEREGIATIPEDYDERVRLAQAIVANAPVLDDRTPDEILGYDENGLPN
ncbi:type II toxin-antitoxin system VapB family antitoxin [Sphingomonas sp. A2-49]|uniref:type II toxin-antitoxin system VapB family antitoxin n=1 Tax=Sphingomonas sp. A2-49 TaxID=1391375 RepID=UPI0021D1DE25|nr:type II toxin-antitoxin system VapB family antitoxin [Sphingomonas sp. A2-49]MCU6454906.1 type II toxin-antitoxin system VapB family antitoxin [Sphingomonas sp. A2-49]